MNISEIDSTARKAAWHLISILFLAYLINFVDQVTAHQTIYKNSEHC